MINQVEGLITQAISYMEQDKATSIQSEIEMGNDDRYFYEIKRIKRS